MLITRRNLFSLVFVFCLIIVQPGYTAPLEETALDRYVAKPDATFEWSLANTIDGEGFTAYVLDMKSQTWRPKESDRPVWEHWLTIIKPDGVELNKALTEQAQQQAAQGDDEGDDGDGDDGKDKERGQ